MKKSPLAANSVSYQINPKLFLVSQATGGKAAAPPKPEPTNYFLVLDVSGSMWGDIPSMRASIKSKLPTLIGEADTVTIEWFSGRGQFGTIVEGERLATLKDLSKVNAAIDRWLRPQGLTAFKEPIAEIAAIAARVNKVNPGRNALFFMSDGMDNCWPRHEILRAMEQVAPLLSSTTIVEYGPYADQPLLTAMAEKAGGSVIYAQDFGSYEPIFEAAMRRGTPGGKRAQVVLDALPIEGFAFGLAGDEILTFGADLIGGEKAGVSVPESLGEVWYLSENAVGNLVLHTDASMSRDNSVLGPIYAAMSLFAQRVKPKVVWSILRMLGDVSFIDEFALAFGKQRNNAFVDHARAAAFDPILRFPKGRDPNRVPREDATTVIDVFAILAEDPMSRILTNSDSFTYTRIGRRGVSKADMLTVTEGDVVASLSTELATAASSREVQGLRDVVAKLNEILSVRKAPLKFTLDPAMSEAGYAISDMVWNQNMPNLSFRVKQPGTVSLADYDVPEEIRKVLPPVINTYRWKTYTVVKDGFVHLEWVPVRVPKKTLDLLVAIGVVDCNLDVVHKDEHVEGMYRVVLDLRRTPVVNQKMISDVSAVAFAERSWELIQLQAAAKVYGHFTPERESRGFATVYGPAAAKWLDEHGVTDHSGFKVDATEAPATDFYLAKALDVKIPGFSSLPSVKDLRERMDAVAEHDKVIKAGGKVKGKLKELTPSMNVMAPYLREVDNFLATDVYKNAADKDALFARWVADKADLAIKRKRYLQTENAKTVFTITVAGTWFKEFTSLSEDKLTIPLGGEPREVQFQLDTEKRINI